MQTPLQITFRGLSSSESLEAKIRDKVTKLEEFHPAISSCRVVVEELRQTAQGKLFNVRLDIRVPGHEFAVNRDHDGDVYVALRDAFDTAKRVLEDEVRRMRGDIKNHESTSRGHAARLDAGRGAL